MILSGLIIFILCLLIFGLLRSFQVKNPQFNSYSILIACRNEKDNLPLLFNSLEKLNYQEEHFEIILVDDASQDNSYELIKKFCSKQKNASCFRLTDKSIEYKGKKAALKLAAEQAKHDFLLFTDADCQVPENLLQDYNLFINEKIGAVIGYYLENTTVSLRRFMKLLNAGLFAATTGLGVPFSAAGGNFCVRKKAFVEVGGYEKIKDAIAGDDKLLLNLLNKTSWKIAYNPISTVLTQPELSLNKRTEQLKRQYGKFDSFSPVFKVLISIVALFYLYLPFSLMKSLKALSIYYFFTLLFWFFNVHKHNEKILVSDFFWLLVYPYLAIYWGVRGNFTRWKWKGN
jgi:cellulose synthase/poly-beta-1,6-N-acetylglucosamine synthase-like glycosyltransferase